MKRDSDLYRRILLAVEQSDNNPDKSVEPSFAGDYLSVVLRLPK